MTSGRLSLGVLDFGLRSGQGSDADELRLLVDRATEADRLGYARYWLGEHHANGVCYGSPAALVPILAGLTDRIRVGSAAHSLFGHVPARLAADYSVYEALFPGRIDLGVGGGGPGAVPDELRSRSDLPYVDRFAELVRSVESGESGEQRLPPLGARPRLWSMGAGGVGLDLARRHATAYSHARWLARGPDDELRVRLAAWRDEALLAPTINVAVAGACAPTEEEARAVATACPLPIRPDIVGTPARCADWLHGLAGRLGVDELVFLDLSTIPSQRLRTLDLLATELYR